MFLTGFSLGRATLDILFVACDWKYPKCSDNRRAGWMEASTTDGLYWRPTQRLSRSASKLVGLWSNQEFSELIQPEGGKYLKIFTENFLFWKLVPSWSVRILLFLSSCHTFKRCGLHSSVDKMHCVDCAVWELWHLDSNTTNGTRSNNFSANVPTVAFLHLGKFFKWFMSLKSGHY